MALAVHRHSRMISSSLKNENVLRRALKLINDELEVGQEFGRYEFLDKLRDDILKQVTFAYNYDSFKILYGKSRYDDILADIDRGTEIVRPDNDQGDKSEVPAGDENAETSGDP